MVPKTSNVGRIPTEVTRMPPAMAGSESAA